MVSARTGVVVLLVALGLPRSPMAAPPSVSPVYTVTESAKRTTLVVAFEAPLLFESESGTRIHVEDCLPDIVPGAPALPVRGLTVPIPSGARPRSISITPGRTATLSLDRPVAPAEEPVALSAGRTARHRTATDRAIYARLTPYPDYATAEQRRPRRDRLHGDDLLTLTLHPVQYIPARDLLLAHRELTVDIHWEPIPDKERSRSWRPKRKLPRAEADAVAAGSPLRQIHRAPSVRPTTAVPAGKPSTAHLAGVSGEASELTMLEPAGGPHPLEWSGPIDHVIIAPSNFIAASPGPWSLAALAEARRNAGLNSAPVSIEWIAANYPGRDTAERMRAFIRDAYDNWETRFVLLVGTTALVPTRYLYCSFSAATDLIPADSLYFGCLDGSFDRDGDSVFGEIGDGDDGWDIDLVAEVFVGRFPAANLSDVTNMVRKTLTYESLPADALKPISHIGEWLGFGGDGEYATGAMEQIRLGSSSAGFTSIGFLSSYMNSQLTATDTLYDSPTYRWPASEMLSRLNQNIHVFNHLGHGATQIGFKLDLSKAANRNAIASLSNTQPYFIYSQACYVGAYDNVNCLARQFTASAGGPFATLMNSRYGWGYRESNDGPSQLFNRKFWDVAFKGDAYHFGAINARSRETLRSLISAYAGNVFRWIYYELTLFGDPATPFAAPLLNLPPTLDASGLQANHYPGEPLTVSVKLGPVSLIDTATPRIVWRLQDDPPGTSRTNALIHQSRLHFEATLPEQPLGTVVDYTLHAETLAGLSARWPADGVQQTAVTEALTLTVTGIPAPYGAADPPYGAHTIASGNVVQASAPPRVLLSTDTSQTCLGSTGSGSVSDGTSHTNTFTLLADSQLDWLWIDAYLLRQTSNIPGLLNATIWYNVDQLAQTAVAPDRYHHGGTEYRFVDWWMNGNRQPSAHAPASNPLLDIPMTAPVTVQARYLDAHLDSDGNGIADWWELRYYGALGRFGPDDDSDGDGFTTEEEFGDLSDPTNPISFPAPPSIQHTRLTAKQAAPPPYAVSARITDTHSVTNARLRWQKNGGAWQSHPLTLVGLNMYTGVLAAAATFGDQIVYQIEASDPGGRTAIAGPYTLDLAYPQASMSPAPTLSCIVPRGSNTTVTLVLTNSGNDTMHWTLHPALFEPVREETTNTWTLNALGQPWVLSTQRVASPPYALHGAPKSAGSYSAPAVHAGLRSPILVPESDSTLSFRYWIASELDTARPGFAFDGMIVQVSTNGGLAFMQLPGPYTHRITGWTYSPWIQDTPCFAGNGSQGWRDATFDLSRFAGKPIQLRFVYGGDNNTDGEGVYLDDIEISVLTPSYWPAWLVPSQTDGSLAFSATDTIALSVNVAHSTARELLQRIVLRSNDPIAPRLHTDLHVAIRAIPWLGQPQASQTSTQGEGHVTLCVPLADPDGDPLSLTVRYAVDEQSPWSVPLLFDPAPQFGLPTLDVTNAALYGIATHDGLQPATNIITVRWDTQATLPGLPPLVPGMRLRLSASNAWFSTPPVETPPFMVDNEPPSTPTGLQSASHAIGTWSRDTDFAAAWTGSGDGAGVGGIRYFIRLSPDSSDTLDGALSVAASAVVLDVADGANQWLAVQARDAYGNRSSIARIGAFFIDATPPDTAGATVHIVRSAFGDYVVGDRLTTRWGGFTDPLSGIAGYQILVQTPSALVPYLMTTQTQAVVRVSSLNATNGVWVYAFDHVGNSSLMRGDRVLVLDPGGDWDGDGYTNADEELAGTDSDDAQSMLRLFTLRTAAPAGAFAVAWMGLQGRTYTLLHADTLLPTPDWRPVAGRTAVAGTGDWMIHVPDPAMPAGFFKLRVE